MNKDVLSRENHAFFYVDLAQALMSIQFEEVASAATRRLEYLSTLNDDERELEEIDPHRQFGTFPFQCHNGELGYLQIGLQSAYNCQNGLVANSFWQHRIPQSIGGTFNDRCTIEEGKYSIDIRIIGYESSSHGVVSDPTVTDIPDDEPLGRVVAVLVTPNAERTPEDSLFPVDELLCVWNERLSMIPF